MHALRRQLLIGATLPALSACAVTRDASQPMNRITDRLPDQRGRQHLVALLPGAWDQPIDFQHFGFVGQLRDRGLPVDIVAIDSHVGYFNNGSIADRIHDEVVAPARAEGYRSIWLVGISLGGLGSMLCASRYPGIDGIVALAPYIATRDVIAEVRAAGGLAAWGAGPVPPRSDWERWLLKWLAGYADPALRAQRPELMLAYGRQDRFADSLSLVAPVLPAPDVITIDGGHEWQTWRELWYRVLQADAQRLLRARPADGPRR